MLLSRLREERARVYQSIRVRDDPQWSWRRPVASGIDVTVDDVWGLSAFYGCLSAIAQPCGVFPMKVYEKTADGRREADNHQLYPLVHDEPNPTMAAQTFLEAIAQHAAGTGNGLAWIEWSKAYQPKALWLLRPDRTRIEKKDGRLKYHVTNDAGHEEPFEDWEILHVVGMGWDGCRGYNPIDLMIETFGTAIALERFAGTYFANGLAPSGVLKHPKTLGDKAYERLKRAMDERHGGALNKHRSMILEEGMDWGQVSVDPQKAQALESRQFSDLAICRFMRVPASEIDVSGGKDSLTYSTLEQDQRRYLGRTIQVWASRITSEFNRKLFSTAQKGRFYCEYVLDAFAAGDLKSQGDYFQRATGNRAWMTPNDVRKLKNLPPHPNGDELSPQAVTPAPSIDTPAPAAGGKNAARAAVDVMLADAVSRCVAREFKGIDAARPKFEREGAASLKAWAEAFYRGHGDYVRRAVEPVLRASSAGGLLLVDPVASARELAAAYVGGAIARVMDPDALGRNWTREIAQATLNDIAQKAAAPAATEEEP